MCLLLTIIASKTRNLTRPPPPFRSPSCKLQFFIAALRDANGSVTNYVGVQCKVSEAYARNVCAKQSVAGLGEDGKKEVRGPKSNLFPTPPHHPFDCFAR